MNGVERIKTDDFSQVRAGDSISILFVDKNLVMGGLHVKGKPGKLYVSIGKEYHGGPERIFKLKDVTDKHKLEAIVRKVKREGYKRDRKQIDFTRYASKKGTRAALEDALETVQSVVDHFDYRVSVGDPLFDQWMVDAYESSQKAVAEMLILKKALYMDEEES